MSDPTPAPTPALAPAPAPTEPLGEKGIKALQEERDARAAAERRAADLQKQIDDINAAQMSDIEKAQKAAADAASDAEKARTEALRYRIAAKHAISDEDAELFLTGKDEATLTKQAERLKERTPTTPGLFVPGEGRTPVKPGGSTTADLFADAIRGGLNHR